MGEGRRSKWRKIKFYALIVTVCIALAAGLNLILGERENRSSDPGVDPQALERLKEALADRLDEETKAKLKKAREGELTEREIRKLKQEVEKKLDPREVEQLRRAYEARGEEHRRRP
jgi:hypothetical protein